MDRIAAVLRFQWRAYWRRFKRKGNLTTNNAGVWILIGGLGFFKYLGQLPAVASQLARNETARYETLLTAVFFVWLFPVMGESWRSISTRGLLHTPLTVTQLFWIRVGSVFVSPVSWIVAACSLTLLYPIMKAAHPVTGIVGLLLFLLLSLSMSLTIAHALSNGYVRKILFAALIVVSAIVGGSWLASGRVASSWWPNRLVAGAAVAPKVSVLVILAAMTIAAFALAFWSFNKSLESTGAKRSQRFSLFGLIELPGRLGGLVRKDLRYFFRLLDLHFALPIVILFVYYLIAVEEPSASAFRIAMVALFLPGISLAGNLFGLDSPLGLDRYALFPASGRDILLGKNLAFGLFFLILFAAIFPFALWRLGPGTTLIGVIEWLLLTFAYLSWGNWMSVRDPFRMQFYRFSAGGSPFDGIVGLFFGSLPGVIIVLLHREQAAAVWQVALLLLVYSALYYFSLTHSGRRFETQREQIRQAL